MSPENEDPRLGHALAAMQKGREAQLVVRYLEEYLLGRQAQLDKELFDGAPEKWENVVRQKIEAHRFVSKLAQAMKAAEGSARLLQPLMERGLIDEQEAP